MTLALMGMDSLHFAETKVSQGVWGCDERGVRLLQSLFCLYSLGTRVFGAKEKRLVGLLSGRY
jgi:hypothetical protein